MSELNTPANMTELNRIGSEIEQLKKGIDELKSTRDLVSANIIKSEKILADLTDKHINIFKSMYNVPTQVQKQLPLINVTQAMKPHRMDLREHYKRLVFNERVAVRPLCEEIGLSEAAFRGFIKNSLRSTRHSIKKIEAHFKKHTPSPRG